MKYFIFISLIGLFLHACAEENSSSNIFDTLFDSQGATTCIRDLREVKLTPKVDFKLNEDVINITSHEALGDYLFISDYKNMSVRMLDFKGKFIRCLGQQGKGPGEFPQIVDLQLLESTLFILDLRAHRVSLFNGHSGRLLSQHGISKNSIRLSALDKTTFMVQSLGFGLDFSLYENGKPNKSTSVGTAVLDVKNPMVLYGYLGTADGKILFTPTYQNVLAVLNLELNMVKHIHFPEYIGFRQAERDKNSGVYTFPKNRFVNSGLSTTENHVYVSTIHTGEKNAEGRVEEEEFTVVDVFGADDLNYDFSFNIPPSLMVVVNDSLIFFEPTEGRGSYKGTGELAVFRWQTD